MTYLIIPTVACLLLLALLGLAACMMSSKLSREEERRDARESE